MQEISKDEERGEGKYDFESIWKRIYHRVPLGRLKDAKNDSERLKFFKQALRKDKRAKNILKMHNSNLQRFADHIIADLDGKQVSLARFSEKRQKHILEIKKSGKVIDFSEQLFARAEAKGFSIREIKARISERGRVPTQKVLKEGIKVKQFKQGKNEYLALFGKGHRGFIAKVKINSTNEDSTDLNTT